jgi:pyruvate/2-oxoglutarate dehydrogenase complex dihydrolipoamide dehydrogenase (E3) component
MADERFEVVILGSGQGGKKLAWHLARSGRRTAMVERRWIGGSCPNINCLPTKNEIWSARVAHLARVAPRFGTTTGPLATDMVTVRRRKREMVQHQVEEHLHLYETSGVELIMGSGRFVGPKTVEVRTDAGETRRLIGEQVFVNVGTHATMPSIPGLEGTGPITNIEALELDHAPAHLIVLGGGYVGLELAQAFRRFGSEVTVIEHGPQLMSREDPDVAEEMQRILVAEGIECLVQAETLHVRGRSGDAVDLVMRSRAGERVIQGSDILLAGGRTPNTAGIGLEVAGVELDDHGFVRVNERLETTAPGVWALGECAGSPQFTHVSVDDFRVIRDNLAGAAGSTRDRLVPYCMFTDPPLARVGLGERDARRQGVPVRVARLPMSEVLRAQTTDELDGFMKTLVGADDRILGFTMIGSEAGEVVAVVQTAMLAGLPYTVLREAVLAHPTMAEGLGSLFAAVAPRSAAAATPRGVLLAP